MHSRHPRADDRPFSLAAIVTNFRHGPFLREAVDSVLCQSMPVDEIIVVDDASGPADEPYLAELDKVARVLRLPENRGPGGARQAGSDATTCEWIAYLDGDDLWNPRKIERQVEHIRSVGGSPVSHTGTVVFDQDGGERAFVDVKPLELDLALQLRRNQVAPPTVMMPRQLLKEVGGWAPGQRLVEDWDLFIRVVQAGHRVVALREPLTRVRRTGHEHLSASGLPQIRRIVATLRKHRDVVTSVLGPGAYPELMRHLLLDHRHRFSRTVQLRLMLSARLAGASLPHRAWEWLL